MTPSKEEAFKALPDILYVIDQCMASHVWGQRVKPILEGSVGHLVDKSIVQIVENSTIESTLIFLRKLNEFFGTRPQNADDDALRAYHFGDFKNNGWFLTKAESAELHILVGHMSVEEVRHGKKVWPIEDYVLRALSKACSFLTFISQSSDVDRTTANQVTKKLMLLRTYLGRV